MDVSGMTIAEVFEITKKERLENAEKLQELPVVKFDHYDNEKAIDYHVRHPDVYKEYKLTTITHQEHQLLTKTTLAKPVVLPKLEEVDESLGNYSYFVLEQSEALHVMQTLTIPGKRSRYTPLNML